MAWFNSSMCSSKTLGWSCHSCVESWSSSGLKWILGHCVSAGLIQNLLDESDLSSYNWDLIFRSIYKAFQWPDCDMYFDRAQLKPCLFYWFRNQTTSHLLIHQNFSSINESCWKISNCQKRCVCVCTCVWEVDLKSMTMETVPSHSQGSAKDDGKRKKAGMESKKKIESSHKILRLSLHEMHVMTRWGGVCGC